MTLHADASTFETEVVERSRRQPVVVDFWAEWCGPCHQLSPILERVAQRYEGDVALVKVDVDGSPDLARRYRVQGIPAVKAFKDGAVVSEFTGVQPEQAVDQFFAAVAPTPADRLVQQAAGAADPEALLREAVETEPGHEQATLGLARLLADRGDVDEAMGLLEKIPSSDEGRALRSRLHLSGSEGDVDALRAAVEAGDPDARVRLGRTLAGRGAYEEALDLLLAGVGEPSTREEARQAVLEVFDVLGNEHELVRSTRPRLASALYA